MIKSTLSCLTLCPSVLVNAQYKPILADDINDLNQTSLPVVVHSNDSFLYISCKYQGKTEEIVAVNTYDSTVGRTGVS